MNMDYPELPKPFYLRKVDGVPTITVAEHEALMRAYVDADRAQRAAQPPQQSAQPVAWMHETPGRVDVIHDEVKKLLSAAATDYLHRPIDKSEKYTIPLYAAAQPVEVQRPVIVPGDARAEDMNLKYGESYGVDWEYESGPQTTQTSEPSVISHKLVPLTDEQISLLAHNEDEGDWNDLQFRDCWHKGFKDGFRNAEASLGIKPTSSEGGAA